MITIIDCLKALSMAIEDEFGAAPITKDIQEGYDRPGTYVYPTAVQSNIEGELLHDSYTFEITRFSEDDYFGYLELLEYKTRLQTLLGRSVSVSDSFMMYPVDQSFSIDTADYALTVSFTVDNYQLIDDETGETEPELMLELYHREENA